MEVKNILVVNDDGITARGIHELAKALNKVAKVYVCAPDRQRTASGHGITIGERLLLKEEKFPEAEKAYSCSGTPADCVRLGLRVYKEQGIKIDMVCSGINHGANLGTDVLYSGTVSAALEGVLCGVASVAFSCCSHEAVHFEGFEKLVPHICAVAFEKLDDKTILNVNVPDVPLSEIKGLKFAKIGMREYEDEFIAVPGAQGEMYYDYTAEAVVYENLPEGVDVKAFQEGYITVTPLQYDLTSYRLIDQIENWGIRFER